MEISLTTNVHILDEQVSRTVVEETAAQILVVEQRSQLLQQCLLSIVFINVARLLDHCEALIKRLSTILLAHESLEFGELARGNVDHLFLADAA